jgi:hypothetical protein
MQKQRDGHKVLYVGVRAEEFQQSETVVVFGPSIQFNIIYIIRIYRHLKESGIFANKGLQRDIEFLVQRPDHLQ